MKRGMGLKKEKKKGRNVIGLPQSSKHGNAYRTQAGEIPLNPVVKLLLLSKRWSILIGARLGRAEARARSAESRSGVPDRRPEVFEHSMHSVWLSRHLNSV